MSLKNSIRKLFNIAGLDVSRADHGAPRWSGIAEDYYPINVRSRWGHGHSTHTQLERIFLSQLDEFKALLVDFQDFQKYFATISNEQTSPTAPYWNNPWFSTLDAASLMYFTSTRAPNRYIEIGSGLSTRFVK